MRFLRSTALALVLAGGISAAAAPARAGPEDDTIGPEVLEELKKLRERVGELEDWKSKRELEDAARARGDDQALREAIDQILAERDPGTLEFGYVRAPKVLGIDLGGQVRARGEMLNDSYAPGTPDGGISDNFWLGRARLRADIHILKDLDARIEFQDARTWGSESSTAANLSNTDLSEGWVEFRNIADVPLSARVGRQAVNLSDQRFVGALEWANNARRFDGLTVAYKDDNLTAVAFGYRVIEEGLSIGSLDGKDTDLFGAWLTFPGFLEDSTLETFGIFLNSTAEALSELEEDVPQDQGRTRFGTYGMRVHGAQEDGPVSWDFQGATQRGEWAGDDIVAWAARGEVGMQLDDDGMKPKVSVEYNFASGDSRTDDGKHQQFETLFPTNHGYYGIHDYMAWENTRSWAAHLMLTPSKTVKVKTSFWVFELDETAGGWVNAPGRTIRPGVNTGADRSLGKELDVVITWQANERVQFQLGWAHFFEGSFVRNTQLTGKARDSDFAYLQCLVTF